MIGRRVRISSPPTGQALSHPHPESLRSSLLPYLAPVGLSPRPLGTYGICADTAQPALRPAPSTKSARSGRDTPSIIIGRKLVSARDEWGADVLWISSPPASRKKQAVVLRNPTAGRLVLAPAPPSRQLSLAHLRKHHGRRERQLQHLRRATDQSHIGQRLRRPNTLASGSHARPSIYILTRRASIIRNASSSRALRPPKMASNSSTSFRTTLRSSASPSRLQPVLARQT